jgi:hypothetical protein
MREAAREAALSDSLRDLTRRVEELAGSVDRLSAEVALLRLAAPAIQPAVSPSAPWSLPIPTTGTPLPSRPVITCATVSAAPGSFADASATTRVPFAPKPCWDEDREQ